MLPSDRYALPLDPPAPTPEQGAFYRGDGTTDFCVWAPLVAHIELHLTAPTDQLIPMAKGADGYHRVTVPAGLAAPGARYLYRLDERAERPDPASRAQPDGVHAASMVVDLPPLDSTGWHGLPMRDLICYELHVGTFTEAGTFEAIIPHLDTLHGIGITAIEIMPVAAFPGARNWGYDGAYFYAAQESYGGAYGFRKLIEAAHARGIAVILDVVYNHLGPEGNYLREFAPYFTGHYRTPWGLALNFDGRDSDHVRAYITNNIRWWTHVGVDGFRLDAVQELYDMTSYHILREIADTAAECSIALDRKILIIAESSLNDPRLTDSPERNGYGLDGEWADDFHHAVHAVITGELMGYYADFGLLDTLARTLRQGYARTGVYSRTRGRRHGTMPPPHMTADKFVVCVQNHDQIGNRTIGDRLTATLDFEALKLLAGLLLLSPYVPLLFMGEEYGEVAPFPFFVDHGDPAVLEATRRGRAEEMRLYELSIAMPDPGDAATFQSAKLNHALRGEGRHKTLQDLYTRLITLRRTHPALSQPSKDDLTVSADETTKVLTLRRWHTGAEAIAVYNFGTTVSEVVLPAAREGGAWTLLLCSWTSEWGGLESLAAAPDGVSGAVAIAVPAHGFALYAAG